MEKVDRRIIKSQKAIQSAFLSMLVEEGFDEINVKKLTERADVSRKTFYLHYVDLYDLLDVMVNKELEELEEICEQKQEKGFVEGTVIWFQYFERNKPFFAALFASRSTVSFRERLLEFMVNQLRKKVTSGTEQEAEIALRFIGMAVLGMMEFFLLDRLEGTTEQIAQQVGSLMLQTMSQSPPSLLSVQAAPLN